MSSSDRKAILVTGGVGFVGSHFVRRASETGRRVVVLDDLSGGGEAQLPRGVELVHGDIGDKDLVRDVVRRTGVSALAHFAGLIQVGESVRVPQRYFDINACRTVCLLDVMREEEVTNVLFSSTAAVYGVPEAVPIPETARLAPINPYGASKLTTEYVLAAYGIAHGMRWAALRYFNAAGAHPDGTLRESHEPETHLIPLAIDAALGSRPPLEVFGDDYDTPDGTCIRDYVHVCDLADAHLAALERLEKGQTIGPANLGSGSGYSVREVMGAVSAVLGSAVPHRVGPRRAGDPARLVADPSRAQSVLGWTTTRSELAVVVEDAFRSRMHTSKSRVPGMSASDGASGDRNAENFE